MTKHTIHITAAHQEAFAALTSGTFNKFAFFSCTVGGEPAASIVTLHQDGDGFTLQALFVRVTRHDACRPRWFGTKPALVYACPHAVWPACHSTSANEHARCPYGSYASNSAC